MISREQQKAILEGMLFVSTKPVTLSQMVRKIRQAIRWDRTERGEDIVAAEGAQALPVVALEAAVETVQAAALEETVVAEEFEAEACDDPMVAGVADGASEIAPVGGLESNEDTGVLEQLLRKQKELEDDVSKDEIKKILAEIQAGLAATDHGIELVCVAKGYQLRTKFEISRLLRDEQVEAPTRMSPSSLETLAIVAYQQPITRQKIEEVRGVDCGGVLKTLLEKGMLRIVGRSEEPGRPLIYGTTPHFLEIFGLNSLKDLPSLSDLADLQLTTPEGATVLAPVAGLDEAPDLAVEALIAEEVTDVSEAERAILDDLDASLKGLRDVERTIFPPTTKPAGEGAAETAPSDASLKT